MARTIGIIAGNEKIRRVLIDRFDELKMSNRHICDDAKGWGVNIDPARLSRYLNGKPNGVNEDTILFFIQRYCIPFYLNVQSYKKLNNFKELGLPEGTLVPVELEYSIDKAEERLYKHGYQKKRNI